MDIFNQKTLLQCNCCKMYRVIDQSEHNWLQKFSREQNELFVGIICFSCREKESLLLQIEDLSSTIHKLNKRIDSLQKIRDLEESFDKTVDDISDQLSALHFTQIVHEEEVKTTNSSRGNSTPIIRNATFRVQINDMNDTSVWEDGQNSESDQSRSSSSHSEESTSEDESKVSETALDLVVSDLINTQDTGSQTDQGQSYVCKMDKTSQTDQALTDVPKTATSSQTESTQTDHEDKIDVSKMDSIAQTEPSVEESENYEGNPTADGESIIIIDDVATENNELSYIKQIPGTSTECIDVKGMHLPEVIDAMTVNVSQPQT